MIDRRRTMRVAKSPKALFKRFGLVSGDVVKEGETGRAKLVASGNIRITARQFSSRLNCPFK
jgi:hypothetical protein